MKFNVGDEVRKRYAGGGRGIIVRATEKDGKSTYTLQYSSGDLSLHWWHDRELILIRRKSMYEQGQILVDDDGDERKVLASLDGVDGKVYLLSYDNNFDRASEWFTEKELKENGYKLKQDTTPTELTIEEIAEKFNLKPEEVRIKKED